MVEPDLKFLSGQMERLIGDVASLTDEMRVLSAIVIRLDSGQSAVLAELRAIVTQVAQMNDRIRKHEGFDD